MVCLDSVVGAAAWVLAEYGADGARGVQAAEQAVMRRVFGMLVSEWCCWCWCC